MVLICLFAFLFAYLFVNTFYLSSLLEIILLVAQVKVTCQIVGVTFGS